MLKFYCYSMRLHRFFESKGILPIYMGFNKKTNSFFWVYEGTDELNRLKDEVYPICRDDY